MVHALRVEVLQGATSLISHCNEDAVFFFSSQGKVCELWAVFEPTLSSWFWISRHCGWIWLTFQDVLGLQLAFCEPDDHCKLFLQDCVQMVPHLHISRPLAPIPKQPPNVADVIGIVASCPFRVRHLLFGRDVSGLPLAALLFLLAFSLSIAQVSLRLSVNAVAALELGNGSRPFIGLCRLLV